MYIVTGGAGFIGSAFVARLNREGIDDILIVDRLRTGTKWLNLRGRAFHDVIEPDEFLHRLEGGHLPRGISGVIHMGACSSTTERDGDFLIRNNYRFSRTVADWARTHGARFIYASSAAVYGDGTLGYSDDPQLTSELRPLNLYGWSKQLFDLWVVRSGFVNQMAGLRFFNVFGPNEYHKESMRSVANKAFHEIRSTGRMRLFRSNSPRFPDGGQMRDFVYVQDCVEVMWWLLQHREANGIFNLGTGTARSWNDLAGAVFGALNLPVQIDYIDMPPELSRQYQNFTEADMSSLKQVGCPVTFRPLEQTVGEYVTKHLASEYPWL